MGVGNVIARDSSRLVIAVLLGAVVWFGVGFVARTVVSPEYGLLTGLGSGVVFAYGVWRYLPE